MAATSMVRPGYYFSPRRLRLAAVHAGTALPGAELDGCVRVPAPLVVPLALALGASFVFFLPVVGFALVLRHLGTTAWGRKR